MPLFRHEDISVRHSGLAKGSQELIPITTHRIETALALDREVMRSCIISEPFWWLMRLDNPAGATEELTLVDYLAAPHVVTSMAGEDTDHVDAILALQGASRRKVVTVPSFMAAAWYATSSDMIATLPETVARRACDRTGGVLRKAPLDLPNSVAYLWWHPRFHNDEGHSCGASCCRTRSRRIASYRSGEERPRHWGRV